VMKYSTLVVVKVILAFVGGESILLLFFY
jgi:hypothetical protein